VGERMILNKYKTHEVKTLETGEYEDYVLWQSRESGADKCANLVFNDLEKYKIKSDFQLDLTDKIMDVGCRGNAEVVRKFHSLGYIEAYGVDIGYDAEKLWDSLPNDIQDKLKRADVQDGLHFNTKFNFITCSHVLEHCPNPKKVMEVFNESLTTDGLIHIQIPLSTYDEYINHYPHFAYWENKEAFFDFISETGFIVEYWEYGTADNRVPFDDLMVFIRKVK
jgi:2-polyprenyl-3-methyl-5-hydroxy-6-metoxy-1,4-benzoquinol methylase